LTASTHARIYSIEGSAEQRAKLWPLIGLRVDLI
jgi:hypothetical protein